ncbi:MAG: hypothetical protein R3F39_22985 [Myxococcota bacterium]
MARDDKSEEVRQAAGRRVVFALLGPAVRLAFTLGIPLRELRDSVRLAYFKETRRRGQVMREAAETLDVSMRTLAVLSSELKQQFLDGEDEVGLPRRVEFMLWAAPLSAARLRQVLRGVEDAAVDRALKQLLAQGRIREIPGRTVRFEVVRSEFRLVDEKGWLARVDALENFMGTVAHAVYARFFREEPRAFARTLSFYVRPESMDRLRELYEKTVWETLRTLDAEAKGHPDAEMIDLSILWAPYDYLATLEEGE